MALIFVYCIITQMQKLCKKNDLWNLRISKIIFASGLNERENKVSAYVNERGDFTELYELVPEDAVLLQYIPVDSMELIELC